MVFVFNDRENAAFYKIHYLFVGVHCRRGSAGVHCTQIAVVRRRAQNEATQPINGKSLTRD
jgi:hypothetical protein